MFLPDGFKPLLASPLELDLVRFPLFVSPKLDGIRCIVAFRDVLSRNMKPIPNDFVREELAGFTTMVLDGELMTYTDGRLDNFNTCQSKLMAKRGTPDFRFHVFDAVTRDERFEDRLGWAVMSCSGHPRMTPVSHRLVTSASQLSAVESEYVAQGYEGLMARDPAGRYKFGRSTAREGILLKMKRFHDAEALVVGYTERMTNQNEQTRDELGRAKRSSHKANMVPTNSLGSLLCEFNGVEFEVGTGFDDAQRRALWQRPDELLGRRVKFKYQELGPNRAPRFPVFLGFREGEE